MYGNKCVPSFCEGSNFVSSSAFSCQPERYIRPLGQDSPHTNSPFPPQLTSLAASASEISGTPPAAGIFLSCNSLVNEIQLLFWNVGSAPPSVPRIGEGAGSLS